MSEPQPPARAAEDAAHPTPDPSELFMRIIPVGANIAKRPIAFYLGLSKHNRTTTERLILAHGGNISPTARPSAIALIDPHSRALPDGPPAYSINYITCCISSGRLLDPEDFRIPPSLPPLASTARRSARAGSRTRRSAPPHNAVQPPTTPAPLPSARRTRSATRASRPSTRSAQRDSPIPLRDAIEQPPATPPATRRATSDANPSPHLASTTRVPVPSPPHRREQRGRAVVIPPETQSQDAPPPPCPSQRSPPGKRKQPVNPTVNTPPPPSTKWTHAEDRELYALYVSLARNVRPQTDDPLRPYNLSLWTALGNDDLLPPGRCADACLRRCTILLIKRNKSKAARASSERAPATSDGASPKASGAGRRTAAASAKKTASPSRDDSPSTTGQPASDTTPPTTRRSRRPKTASVGERMSRRRGSVPTQTVSPPAPSIVRRSNAERKRSRARVVQLVDAIARRAKVSPRKAFLALRKAKGDGELAARILADGKM